MVDTIRSEATILAELNKAVVAANALRISELSKELTSVVRDKAQAQLEAVQAVAATVTKKLQAAMLEAEKQFRNSLTDDERNVVEFVKFYNDGSLLDCSIRKTPAAPRKASTKATTNGKPTVELLKQPALAKAIYNAPKAYQKFPEHGKTFAIANKLTNGQNNRKYQMRLKLLELANKTS